MKIGDIVFKLYPLLPSVHSIFEQMYGGFITEEDPQVSLKIQTGSLPDLREWLLIFDAGGVWRLWSHMGQWAIESRSPLIPGGTYQIAVLDQQFLHGIVYMLNPDPGAWSFPFEDTFAELLMVLLLSQGSGVLMHACAVKDGQVGRLFVGQSGAGKSTTANLWRSIPDIHLLSDDRVIIRKTGVEYRQYGTPWHSDAWAASPESARLQQIFLLKQEKSNTLRRLEPVEAVGWLLSCAFPTFWDAQGMQFTLQFLADLCQSVPCYELGFLPQPDVVDFVRSVL